MLNSYVTFDPFMPTDPLNAKALMSPESYQQFNGKPAEDLGPVDLARVGRQPAIFVGI